MQLKFYFCSILSENRRELCSSFPAIAVKGMSDIKIANKTFRIRDGRANQQPHQFFIVLSVLERDLTDM